jgi:hypothetical protein|nr:MAG TPA: TFIIB zinc-binding [Caudoviricetes sp.]
MPRTIVYKAGGFTNCGIGYTKFSQEELAEMKDRVMTENEAIEELKYDCNELGKAIPCDTSWGKSFENAYAMAINALEEVQKYRKIEKDLKERYHANVDIPLLMHHFIETVFEGEKHEGFCLLTNEDAKVWEEYKAIGTPEECRTAVEKQTARKGIREKIKKGYNRGMHHYYCPVCYEKGDLRNKYNVGLYCSGCGQKLDWGDEE